MLKNKKCQALLIAASAFIGIEGNVYGSNLSYTMDDVAIVNRRIADIKHIGSSIHDDIKKSCNAYHDRTMSIGEVIENVISILKTGKKELHEAVYANPSNIDPNYDKYRNVPTGDYINSRNTVNVLKKHGDDSIDKVQKIIDLCRWTLSDDRLIELIEIENMDFLTFCQSN